MLNRVSQIAKVMTRAGTQTQEMEPAIGEGDQELEKRLDQKEKEKEKEKRNGARTGSPLCPTHLCRRQGEGVREGDPKPPRACFLALSTGFCTPGGRDRSPCATAGSS
jgi:hypothetical protein